MNVIIEVESGHHLGDNIINFIFFYKIKDYIEKNNIIIHYYCYPQYHKNLNDFNCSNNIKILNYEGKGKGYVLHQGGNTPHRHYIEDKLCNMFNIFLSVHRIPISVSVFEYEDPDLIERFNALENKYKNIDILIINSNPLSGQYVYNKNEWDNYILKLSKKHSIATSETVNENILSLEKFSVKNIAAVALNVQIIIAINTGPSIPLYNKNILDNVTQIYLFGGANFKTRKIQCVISLQQLSFLL
jgi:hypothetical protein